MKKVKINRKVVMHSKLENLIRLKRDITVTYVNEDKTRVSQTLNPEFITKKNGKTRNINNILNDLYAITHDIKAKYFFI